ncbi:MAG: terminase large subunit, partial [Candidatus Peribacteraceae bacterium]|nr:terminase large subunit [Candidatus Peribacteraceae bacterium]
KYEVMEFETPKKAQWYYGADWGSLVGDPSVLNRSFVLNNCLYVSDEVSGNWSLDDHASKFNEVPGSMQHKITADSARPETIEFLNSRGFFIVPAVKGKGSIEDGIERLKNFERIYIHPRCTNMIEEMRLYCYKQDKRTGKISTVPEDSNNHSIDALRYATEEYVKSVSSPDFLDAFANY